MDPTRKSFAEINDLINLKLKEGDFATAEKLSNELMTLAETGAADMELTPINTVPLQPIVTEDTHARRLRKWMTGLQIWHFLYGGMTVVFSCFFATGIWAGISMILNPAAWTEGSVDSMTNIGIAILAGSIACMAFGWFSGIMNIMVGRWIHARKRHNWITVVSVLNFFNFPLGTALGLGTLYAVNRVDVKSTFK